VQVANLTQQVANETAQIQKLQQHMKLKNYITIGLSFMWNPSLTPEYVGHPSFLDVRYLHGVIDSLNVIWAPLHIYFFVNAGEPVPFIPETTYCYSSVPWSWAGPAQGHYLGNDIPVAIVTELGTAPSGSAIGHVRIGGCSCVAGTGCSSPGAIGLYVYSDASVLSWELLHVVGGITDEEIVANPNSNLVIPTAWYARIQNIARQFEMPLPPDYPF
jgi:hypothetical protein